MGNPIWRAPVIAIGQKFYCCIPQSIFSHIHDVMKALCESAGLKTALEERRAEYLEDAVHKLLRKALPGATLLLNAEWKIGTELFFRDRPSRTSGQDAVDCRRQVSSIVRVRSARRA
jgi:hypothetical protein